MSSARKTVIKRSDEFQRCYKEGRVFKNRLAVIHVYRREDPGGARVGFSVSRRVGKAVERNRVKRWMREAVYPVLTDLPPGIDIVFSARTRAKQAGLRSLCHAVHDLLRRGNMLPKEADLR